MDSGISTIDAPNSKDNFEVLDLATALLPLTVPKPASAPTRCQGTLRAIWIVLEKKTPHARRVQALRVNVYQPTMERRCSAAWNGIPKLMQ